MRKYDAVVATATGSERLSGITPDLSAIDNKLRSLTLKAHKQDETISDLKLEVENLWCRLDDVMDVITGKMDALYAYEEDERSEYRRAEAKEYHEYKYIIDGSIFSIDEDDMICRETQVPNFVENEEQISALTDMLLKVMEDKKKQSERYDAELHECVRAIDELREEIRLMSDMYAFAIMGEKKF